MKIRKIACEQFAGIQEQSIALTDGINLVYGKNESGKSTLVNLLSRTLFQPARVDGRKDKDFKGLYFPSARKDGRNQGDFIDGAVTIETEQGSYTLKKEWGKESRCTLSTPDGRIRDTDTIEAILREILVYGEGVYTDMLFSSQHNTDTALQTILDASQKTDAKQEITDAVSQAFAESDGITADAIEAAINQKIEEIAGKHWDAEKGAPMRKAGRWATGLGEILTAYYALEDAVRALEDIRRLEQAADTAAADYRIKDKAAQDAEAAYNRFHAFAGQLTMRNERRRRIEQLEKEIEKMHKVLTNWPLLQDEIKKAAALRIEQTNRVTRDRYEAAQKLRGAINTLRNRIGSRECPTQAEIKAVDTAQKKISKLENSLCGMNLNAAIHMLGGHTMRVTSLRTGQAMDITDETLPITEAVTVSIPGVMEMQLSPANVNVAETEAAIAAQKKTMQEIFSRYAVENLDALMQLAKYITDAKGKIELLEERLLTVLDATDYAALEAEAAAIDPNLRSKESIDAEIMALCRDGDLGRYITQRQAMVQVYINEYDAPDALGSRLQGNEKELAEVRESIKAAEKIPTEYMGIADPERHLAMLQSRLKSAQAERDTALVEKSDANGRLESGRESLTADPAEQAADARRIFAEKKALLAHWMHIQTIFEQQKQQIQNHPMRDIAESFARYLAVISGDRISSEFPDAERLNMNIYSGKSLIDYEKLSEGTKETVSLAFRLAVLDHLFPEGGGVIVLDDPFTDMDAERVVQSCRLIQECAKRHQVIFLTCREEYTEMLGGNQIRI